MTISITLGYQDIVQNTSIDGGGLITLDANHNSNIFRVNAGQALTLTSITLINGHTSSDGGCIYVNNGTLSLMNAAVKYCAVDSVHNGGGIASFNGAVTSIDSTLNGNGAWAGAGIYITGTMATLNVIQSTLSGNSAVTYGGAIYNNGTATTSNSTVSGNSAGYGGGIANTGTATLTNSTFSGNLAALGGGIFNSGTLSMTNSVLSSNATTYYQGGAIYNQGTATLSNSTFSNNLASYGGGISNSGTVTISNSTLNGNSARAEGGGIHNFFTGTLTLNNSTVSGNSAGEVGGGLYSGYNVTTVINNSTLSSNSASAGGGLYVYTNSVVSVKNSIVAYSPVGGDCSGGIMLSQYSIASDNTCSLTGTGNLNNVDPLLTALGNYGGPTPVHMLELGSPAIDGVVGTPAPATDQRGLPRSVDGNYDIGAVERQAGDSDLAPRLYLPLVERLIDGITMESNSAIH